jgi:plasmid segregation protein ParM
MLIAIDHGNSAVKTPSVSFTSGLAEYAVRPPLGADVIRLGGRYYALTGERMPFMRDKTRDDRFFVLTLFAIAKEARAAKQNAENLSVDLAVGLPPEHYGALRDRFAAYFTRQDIAFSYNDAPMRLNIRRVLVYPQAYAAVVDRAAELITAPRMFIIDIGGYTTDVLLLREGRPDMQYCRSLEMGVISMANDIIGRVGAHSGVKLEEDHVLSVLGGKETILPADTGAYIREAAENYAARIVDKLRELSVDLRSDPAIFVGGGAALFRQSIEKSPMVRSATFIPDAKANASGYAALAAAQLSREQARAAQSDSPAVDVVNP